MTYLLTLVLLASQPGAVITLSASASGPGIAPVSVERKIVVGNPALPGRYYMGTAHRRWRNVYGELKEYRDPLVAGVECMVTDRYAGGMPCPEVGVMTNRGTVVIGGAEREWDQ